MRDAATLDVIGRVRAEHPVHGQWLSSDGSLLVALCGNAGFNKHLFVWSLPTPRDPAVRLLQDIKTRAEIRLLCGGDVALMEDLSLWDLRRGTRLGSLGFLHNGADWVFVAPDGRFDGNDTAFDHTDITVGDDIRPLRSLDPRLHAPGLLAAYLLGRLGRHVPLAEHLEP